MQKHNAKEMLKVQYKRCSGPGTHTRERVNKNAPAYVGEMGWAAKGGTSQNGVGWVGITGWGGVGWGAGSSTCSLQLVLILFLLDL